MYKENPQTIEELAYYLKYWIDRANPAMPRVDPDHVIGRFVRVCIGNDNYEELSKYPQIVEIGELASDIEIHNGDIEKLWQELKARVDELDEWLAARRK